MYLNDYVINITVLLASAVPHMGFSPVLEAIKSFKFLEQNRWKDGCLIKMQTRGFIKFLSFY